MLKHLGSFYWDEEIGIEGLKANDFDFPESLPNSIRIVAIEPLCDCGNYGQEVSFEIDDVAYSFNFLSGYSCQCGDRA